MKSANTLIALPFALALTANAAPVADSKYLLAMTIVDNGELIGEPKLTVKAGETATIHIEPGDGRKYLATFVSTEKDDETVVVKSDWNATSPTLGAVSFQPKMSVSKGEEARIMYGNEAPGIKPLDVKYTVTLAV